MSFSLKKTFITAAMFTTLLASQQVLAHAHLASASPAEQAVVTTSPDALTLTFTEGIEGSFSGVSVATTEGKNVNAGKLTVDSSDNKTVHVPLNEALKAGSYQVNWHVLSVDGHKTKGTYTFSVK